MSLPDLLHVARRRWRVILLSVIACTGAGAAVAFLSTPVYKSRVQLFVSAEEAGPGNLSTAYQGGLFTQLRVQSYVEIAASPRVTEKVVSDLDLPVTPAQLEGKIEASTPESSVLINIVVDDTDPRRAQAIAAAVGDRFVDVIDELERPAAGTASPVRLSVSRPADLPAEPASPRQKLDLMAGLLAGLLIGVGLAWLRERLDTSVRSVEQFTQRRGLVSLGAIPRAPEPPGGQGPSDPARDEALRKLRTNLDFVGLDEPIRSIVVTSAMAGEGKTATTLGLARAVADTGKGVIVVEADLRKPRMSEDLGLPAGTTGLTSVLVGQQDLDDVLRPGGGPFLSVLTSGPLPPNPAELLASDAMGALLDRLRARWDLVILDAPPLLPVTDASVLAARVDGVLLLARHGSTKEDELDAAVDALERVDATILGLVLNLVPPGQTAYGTYGDSAAGPAPEPHPA